MIKKGFFRRCTAVVLSLIMGLSVLTVAPESETEAKETVYKDDELLYWRFDEGGEEQTILIRTENVPVNLTYTYAQTRYANKLPYDAGKTYYADDNAGSKNSYGKTLLKAGIITATNPEDHAVVFYTDDKKTKYEIWGTQKYTTYNNVKYYWETLNSAGNADEDYYVYDGSVSASIKLPDVITQQQVLSYKVNYDGNAILVPVEAIDYCTDVQGEIVDVTSDDNVKLEFAIEKSSTSPNKVNYKLSRNTIVVRLEAEYTYTRLVPLTGEYNEKQYSAGALQWKTNLGKFGLDPATEKDYIEPIYNSTGARTGFNTYAEYQSVVTDYVNGGTKTIYSACPVKAVKETIHYYKDVECYVIETSEVKSKSVDMKVYLKDFRKSNASVENYTFVKSDAVFSVKYSQAEGFVVKGITRNTDLTWIHGTVPAQSIAGFDGEVVEWWPSGSNIHYYTTPETINDDIDVSTYMDYGAVLFFCDANKPDKVVKVKISARAKSPDIKLKTARDGSLYIDGLRAGKTGIRVCGNDLNYIPFPSTLLTGDGKLFDDSYLDSSDTVDSIYGDQSFYLYSADASKTDKLLLTSLAGISENKNLHSIPGMFIEAQTKATEKRAGSAVSAIYINEQPVFDVNESSTLESIVLKEGKVKINGADKNNAYEYSILGADGSFSRWTKITSSKEVKVRELTDGVTICIRKQAVSTNDNSIFLPSTYIKLTYDGQGKGIPNVYYMPNFYSAVSSEKIELVNDTKNTVKVNGTNVLPGDSYPVNGVFSYTIYSIESGKLIKNMELGICVQGESNDGTKTEGTVDSNQYSLSALFGNDLKSVNVSFADYSTNASKTASFTFTCTNSGHITHTQWVGALTPADNAVAANKKTVKIDSVEYTYYPVNLLRYMVNDN